VRDLIFSLIAASLAQGKMEDVCLVRPVSVRTRLVYAICVQTARSSNGAIEGHWLSDTACARPTSLDMG
jgi:hypothetical protein